MFIRINNALNRRRKALQDNEEGFTLIELLVVVLILGVLAAIAIPIYLGVQATAKDNSAKSSATEAKTAVVAAYTNENSMPIDLTAAKYNVDLTTFPMVYKYAADGTFCISNHYKGSNKFYVVTDKTSVADATADCTSAAG